MLSQWLSYGIKQKLKNRKQGSQKIQLVEKLGELTKPVDFLDTRASDTTNKALNESKKLIWFSKI